MEVKLLSQEDIFILSLKEDMNEILKMQKIDSYNYGMLRGISRTLFTLNKITEEEYRKYSEDAYSNWIPR